MIGSTELCPVACGKGSERSAGCGPTWRPRKPVHAGLLPPSPLFLRQPPRELALGGTVLGRAYEYGTELVLSGHAHVYERFAPQTPSAAADPAFGIRQFVVGTGGNGLYGFQGVKPNSQVRNANTLGVLKLNLRPAGYDWRFLPQAGKTFTDAGSSACHGPGPSPGPSRTNDHRPQRS